MYKWQIAKFWLLPAFIAGVLALFTMFSQVHHSLFYRPCPAGANSVEQVHARGDLQLKERWCELPSGLRHGPIDIWSFSGRKMLSGQFMTGRLDGEWHLLPEGALRMVSCRFIDGRLDAHNLSSASLAACRSPFKVMALLGAW